MRLLETAWLPSTWLAKIPPTHGDRMYRRKDPRQLEFSDFYLPFSGHLAPENHWIRLAQLVPWDQVEDIYHRALCEDSGQPIVPAREALGALLIKEYLGLTDRGTVEAIQENPYLQFFIGREEFSTDRPFDASSMVAFRQRFGEEGVQRISEAIARSSLQKESAQEAAKSIVSNSKCIKAKRIGSTIGL